MNRAPLGQKRPSCFLPPSACNSVKNTLSHIEPPLPIGFDNENTIWRSCPVVKLWPFGDNGDNVEFEFLSKTTAATSDANIGGSSNVYCEIEVFPGDPILLELVCGNPSSASCDSLFEVSPQ